MMTVGHLIVCVTKPHNTFINWLSLACQIDFFVLSYVDYLWLDLDDKVTIKQKDCEIKNYITKHHLSLVQATANERIIPSLLEAKYVPQ